MLFSAAVAGARDCHYVKVTGDKVNVRKSPSVSGAKAGVADYESVYEAYAVSDGWVEIMFNGGPAFISQKFVDIFQSEFPRELISEAYISREPWDAIRQQGDLEFIKIGDDRSNFIIRMGWMRVNPETGEVYPYETHNYVGEYDGKSMLAIASLPSNFNAEEASAADVAREMELYGVPEPMVFDEKGSTIYFQGAKFNAFVKTTALNMLVPLWKKDARSIADKEAVYKEASASSPKLMLDYPYEDGGGDAPGVIRWADENKTADSEESSYWIWPGADLPVVESGSGWSRLLIDGVWAGWVPDSRLQFEDITPVYFPSGSSVTTTGDVDEGFGHDVYLRTSGRFKDYCAFFFTTEMSESGIYIGKLVDGFIVCPKRLDCWPEADEYSSGMTVAGSNVRFAKKYVGTKDGQMVIDFNKLSDDDFENLIRNIPATTDEAVIYGAGRKNRLVRIDTSDYPFPAKRAE